MDHSSTHRFVLLDALRGLAAIFVLFRHTGAFWHFGFFRSYLAVDLFFLLSGFVIAFAYDERLRARTMTLRGFLTVRLIRMYPVYLVSLALCAAVWAQALPAVAVNFALALLFLPWPVPSQPFLFGLNGPYWSLSFELAANFVYGALARVRWALPVLVVVAGVGVGLTAVLYGNLDTGWQWTWPSAGAGLARSVFGVFLGVILYRNYGRVSGWVRWISPWAGFVLVGLVLASPGAGDLDPLADLAAVVLVFPAAVVAVSRHRSDRGRGFLLLLGAASYPLYAMHQQVGLLVQAVLGPLVDEAAPWSGLVLVTVLVALAAGLERFVDLPVRRWLRSRLAPRD